MAFDDLARHMAARDGKQKKLDVVPISAEQFIASEARADRRRDRTRNLILGTILLIGGAAAWILFFLARTAPRAAEDQDMGRLWMLGGIAGGLAVAGFYQVVHGVRGKSGSPRIIDPFQQE